jgi:hypothetical protein
MNNATYKLKRGDKKMIINYTPDGIAIEEGEAELLKPLGRVNEQSEYWLVRFTGEGTADRHPRWVDTQ